MKFGITELIVAVFAGLMYALPFALAILAIRALWKYIHSNGSEAKTPQAKARETAVCKSLGEALKAERTRCKMTQELVADSLGVSRQAVSKWESGASDPSTSNLLALAKLYGISAEELLKKVE